MIPFSLHPDFYDRPIRLSAEEQTDLIPLLQGFFFCFPLSELRTTLWQMLQASLSAPDTVFDDALERQNLLGLYEELERALEAAFLLSQQADHPSSKLLTVAL